MKMLKIVAQVVWALSLIALGTLIGRPSDGPITAGPEPLWPERLGLPLEHSSQRHPSYSFKYSADRSPIAAVQSCEREPPTSASGTKRT